MSSKAEDLDETRRLLYTGIAISRLSNSGASTRHAVLAGTLANALAHHQGRGYTPAEALDLALGIVSGTRGADATALIAKITDELAQEAAE